MVKLTATQYVRTLETLVPGAAPNETAFDQTLPATGDGFSNDSLRQTLPEVHVAFLFQSARAAARRALDPAAKVLPCEAAKVDRTCVVTLLDGFGARAFRRPLTRTEVDGYVAVFEKETAAANAQVGLQQLLTVMFMSPQFLFRTELGDGAGGALTAFERASWLSYLITDGPPDAALWEAARSGALARQEGVLAEARRLLGTATTAGGLLRFFREHLRLEEVKDIAKDAKLFPSWSAGLAADLARESERLVEDVLWQGDGRLGTLLSAEHAFVNERLAAHYGLMGVTGSAFQRVELPAGTRPGLLTRGALMAHLAHEKETDPVARGRFVRERLLCNDLPPAPDDVPPIPANDGKSTQRERLVRHVADPRCAGCHRLMDPIGLAFERYDAAGRFRTTEGGKPIDTSGEVVSIARPIAFTGPEDLQKALASSEEATTCLAQAVYRYALGRALTDADRCAADRAAAELRRSNGDVRGLLQAVVADERLFLPRMTGGTP
jgi:hypothetical protein